jgi:hypothetical protein
VFIATMSAPAGALAPPEPSEAIGDHAFTKILTIDQNMRTGPTVFVMALPVINIDGAGDRHELDSVIFGSIAALRFNVAACMCREFRCIEIGNTNTLTVDDKRVAINHPNFGLRRSS